MEIIYNYLNSDEDGLPFESDSSEGSFLISLQGVFPFYLCLIRNKTDIILLIWS